VILRKLLLTKDTTCLQTPTTVNSQN